MMLLMPKRQKYKLLFIALVFLYTGLFALNKKVSIQDILDKKYTTKLSSKKLFMQQVSNLSYDEQDKFMLGFSFYRIPWVEAPSATTARDGLGPLFSANTCISCHPNNAIASIYNDKGNISRAYVARLSIPSDGSKTHEDYLKYKGFIPEPTYGGQISLNAAHGVPFEAKNQIIYDKKIVTYPDGREVILSSPKNDQASALKDLRYGKLHKNTAITKRLAPALVGLGLLDMLNDEQILANQDINDSNNDGISGKANIVYSPEFEDFRVGRYTWKGSTASVLHQSGAAAHNDMSLSNPLFPNENCTKSQKECLKAPKGDNGRVSSKFDLPMERLEAIAFYLKNLKIPKSKITEKSGERLFSQIGCTSCHIPEFTLANGYKIKPFTDILLHDMGEGLSDGRVEFKAGKNEWRTPALWAIGKYKFATGKEPELLHDGRAKTLEEAILWHGGEGDMSRKRFMNLTKEHRDEVLRYISQL